MLNYEGDRSVWTFTVTVSDVGKEMTGSDEMVVTVVVRNVQEPPKWSTQEENNILYVR
jgi:hypothetical protein